MYIGTMRNLSSRDYHVRFMAMLVLGTAACADLTPPDEATTGPLAINAIACPSSNPGDFCPLHVATVASGAPDLILSGQPTTTIDTTALTIDGVANPNLVQQSGIAVLFTGTFAVLNPVVIQGASPLIVVANGQIIIAANVNLSATLQTPGPGAPAPGPGAGGPGASFFVLPANVRESSGGGGGGYGSVGARGGTRDTTNIPAGVAGSVYSSVPGDPLIGGSAGGRGGFSTGITGLGGGGGGALQLSSAISISVTATINANGGGGISGANGPLGGGGGGAGGELLLEAPLIGVLGGALVANGGGGGGGGSGGGGVSGGNGNGGLVSTAAASGGIGGIPQGSPGGAGAARGTGTFASAQPGDGFNSKGGGGGGGVGRIWLRHRAATPPSLTGAVISPAAGTDPTLP